MRPTFIVSSFMVLYIGCGNFTDMSLSETCHPGNIQIRDCVCNNNQLTRTCAIDKRWGTWQGNCNCEEFSACTDTSKCQESLTCIHEQCLSQCPCETDQLCIEGHCYQQDPQCLEHGLICGNTAQCTITNHEAHCECLPYFQGETCNTCIVYVDIQNTSTTQNGLSWDTAFNDIQFGIAQAEQAIAYTSQSCQVWVAEGNYNVSSYNDTLVMQPRISIYGGFTTDMKEFTQCDPQQYPTTISQLASDNTSVFHLIKAASESTLHGFILSNGQAFGDGEQSQAGAALLIADVFDFTINECIFSHNQAQVRGGAVYITNSTVTINNTIMRFNEATEGGALYNDDSQVEINSCMFLHNSATYGGAIYNDDSTLHISDSTFTGNAADDGGAIYSLLSSPEIYNTSFTENSAQDYGAAIYSLFVEPVISNCDFLDNQSEGDDLYILNGPTKVQYPEEK